MPSPIKRHAALVHFSKEHHFGLLLGWKVRKGIHKNVSPERMARYVRAAWNAEIKPHFSSEENELFTLLDIADPLRLQAERDHAAISLLSKELQVTPDIELLQRFTRMLDEHIRFEERQLFPHIEQQQTFEKFAAAMKTHESTTASGLDDNWDDVFWK